MMKNLTEKQAAKVKSPGIYRVARTLYLRVWPGGSRSWVQRIVIGGRRRDIGLGAWPEVTFAEAKRTALVNRATAIQGGRIESRREALPVTSPFRDIERETYAALSAKWKPGSLTGRNWDQRMRLYVLPVIGNRPIADITQQDILDILIPIWTEKVDTARKTRQHMVAVFRTAQAKGIIRDNPAGERIDGALPKLAAVKEHHAALPWQDVPAALVAIREAQSPVATRACLEFIILTGARKSSASNAEWSEIDLDAKLWTIPAAKMKQSKDFRVPLSPAAVEVLERMRGITDGSGYVFPSPRATGRPVPAPSINTVLPAAGIKRATVHGFRTSLRTYAAENGVSGDVAEMALAHTVKGVEGAYQRSDLLDRRRVLMDRWGAFCTATPAKVSVLRHG